MAAMLDLYGNWNSDALEQDILENRMHWNRNLGLKNLGSLQQHIPVYQYIGSTAAPRPPAMYLTHVPRYTGHLHKGTLLLVQYVTVLSYFNLKNRSCRSKRSLRVATKQISLRQIHDNTTLAPEHIFCDETV